MSEPIATTEEGRKEAQKAHLFLISTPYVFHPKSKPITYLFAINAGCPTEALEHKNWGVVEQTDVAYEEMRRGGIEISQADFHPLLPKREWRIVIGTKEGPVFEESFDEGGWDERSLVSLIKRLPRCVLLIQEILLNTFSTACKMAHVDYHLYHHNEPLCADCVRFGCDGVEVCDNRKPEERSEIEEGLKFHLDSE